MKSIISFLSYNNAIPITAVVLALGAGGVFAATQADIVPTILGATGTSTPAVAAPAPDASFLLATDLAAYTPAATVTGVTEDADNYYVAYTLRTIALVDTTWQQTDEKETLAVSKSVLASRDLGLYVADQLKAKTAQELAYLVRVQQAERDKNAVAQTASVYASLVGKTLNADSSGIAGYTPVVQNTPVVEPSAPIPVQPVVQQQQATAASEIPAVVTNDASSTPVSASMAATSTPDVVATSTDVSASSDSNSTTTAPAATPDASAATSTIPTPAPAAPAAAANVVPADAAVSTGADSAAASVTSTNASSTSAQQ